MRSVIGMFKRFFHAALERGVYLAPSTSEASLMPSAHVDAEVSEALSRSEHAMEAASA